ncbi:AtpI protein, partial [Listeria monocytogenes FSL F6-684]
ATIIATQLPEYFHVYSMVIGLGLAYAIIFLDFFLRIPCTAEKSF